MNKPVLGTATLVVMSSIAMLLVVIGCSTISHKPSAFERKIYLVETNEQVIVKTNYVTITNEAGGVTVQSQLVHKTNELYTLHPNPEKEAVIKGTATGIGDLFGFGGIAGALISGAYSMWASGRNRKVNQTLIQGIETAREVLATTPQGQKADEHLVSWLKNNQREAGVINLVANLVNTSVDNEAAKEAAKLIIERTTK